MSVAAAPTAERRVVRAIADAREELVELVSDLVAFDTTAREPTDPPRDERACQEYLAGRLRASGAQVELWEPRRSELDGTPQLPPGLDFHQRPQLAARLAGAGTGRSLLLNGHIDVVTPEPVERWSSSPWRCELKDGLLYGRGTCDMKGGIACIVMATEMLRRQHIELAGDLLVATNTDEESSGAGSVACVAHGVAADAGICAEPTGGVLWLACRGSQPFSVTVRGRAGHAELAHPHWRDGGPVSAIDAALPVLEAIRGLQRHWKTTEDQAHALLAPGTILTTLISGGEWYVSYPESCRLTANLMYLPNRADDEGFGSAVRSEVEAWLRASAVDDHWLRENPPELEWGPDLPPFEVDERHAIVSTLQSAAELTCGRLTIGGLDSWFDAASYNRSGAATMIGYGPGQTDVAHTIDEHVAVDDLIQCTQTLAITAMRWCGTV